MVEKNNALEVCKNLNIWFEKNDFKGHDPYQLDQKASSFIKKIPALKYVRKALKPLHVFIPTSSFTKLPKIFHPKALGLIIGGNAQLYSITNDSKYIEQSYVLIDILNQLRNTDYKYHAWGSPFEWGSNPRYPVNTPAVCLISPIANCILDFYEINKDETVLELCESISKHIIEENGYLEIDDNTYCLYYSPVDKNLVVNSNALAASFLTRLSMHVNDPELQIFAMKLVKFVISKQRTNGSWNYSNTSQVIDNRHTCFVLESLYIINRLFPDKAIEEACEKGLLFYRNNLMDRDFPRWSDKKTFPIDIHDVAQSILLFSEINDTETASKIITFAIDKMSNGNDEFYYKYFKKGRVNKNVFYRWGQAWMYYAIAKYISKLKLS